MGFLDKFKGKDTGELVDQAKGAVADHGEQIDSAIDKVADLADQATGGKFTEKIDEAAEKLKAAAEDLDDPKA